MTYHEATIYIMAARYAHNRKTGAAYRVVTEIMNNWDKFDKHSKEQLYQESFEAIYNEMDWEILQKRYELENEQHN